VVRALARAVDLHPKVVRKSIRVAFLAPAITIAVVDASHRADLLLGHLDKAVALRDQGILQRPPPSL
jgi:hypothetical protein